jgi:hypothetical protein
MCLHCKGLIIAALVALCLGCSHQPNLDVLGCLDPQTETVQAQKQIPILVQELSKKSRFRTDNTIYVFYRGNSECYNGVPIEPTHYPFFLGKTTHFFPDIHDYEVLKYNQPGEIFATFHFCHGNYIAYLLRAPSAYDSSAIDLWIYNPKTKEWLEAVRVADHFGDAGWYFTLDGWLVDIDGDGFRDLVQRRRDHWLDEDWETERESDSLTVRMWKKDRFLPPRVLTNRESLQIYDIPDWKIRSSVIIPCP